MGASFSSSMHNSMHYINRLHGVSVMTNAPDLYEYALVGAWPKLLARLGSHPHEAKWSDKCKNTALHLVCRRQPPLEVVLALIRSNPVSPTLMTVDGLTPLHFACYCGASPEVISVLIQTNEDAIKMAEKRGKTPLHCTCAAFRTKGREKVIRMLLEYYPEAAILPDEKGRTPLSLIFDDYAEEIEEEKILMEQRVFEEERLLEANKELQPVSPSASLDSIDVHDNQQTSEITQNKMSSKHIKSKELKECLRLVSFLLRAAYHGSIEDPPPDTDKFRILHASVGIPDSPPSFVSLLTKMNPGHDRDIDEKGRLPLHVAASAELFDKKACSHSPIIDIGSSNDDSAKIKKRILNSAAVIKYLLSSYRNAASARDMNGTTPFLLAIESGKPWDAGLKDIINAFSQAFDDEMVVDVVLSALSSESQCLRDETVRTISNLFPFMKQSTVILFIHKFKDSATKNVVPMENEEQNNQNNGVANAMLKALLGLLQQGKNTIQILGINAPQSIEEIGDNKEMTGISQDDLQDILQFCNELVMFPDDQLRETAGKVIGAVCDLTGVEAAMDLLRMMVETKIQSIGKIYTCYGILTADVGTEIVKGGLDVYQEGEQDQLFGQLQDVFKAFLLDEDENIRKSACLAVGAVVGRSNSGSACLKELRGFILKCMKPTEQVEVHVSLARGLTVAVKMNPSIFRGKVGLPILDAALMLAMTGPTRVKMAFNRFLFIALSIKTYDISEALQEYMQISDGENGRIMMTLVTRVLKSLVDFDENLII